MSAGPTVVTFRRAVIDDVRHLRSFRCCGADETAWASEVERGIQVEVPEEMLSGSGLKVQLGLLGSDLVSVLSWYEYPARSLIDIGYLAVHVDWRRRGIGLTSKQELLHHAAQRGLTTVASRTRSSNYKIDGLNNKLSVERSPSAELAGYAECVIRVTPP